ncbi:MAG: DUF5054 domain-containing protein [Clostridiales bacterium]|nr:DUF5054 domain-containing protein [Clostridiales bacterium]
MEYSDVRRVIVVSKTHLDVGYTDYAGAVLRRYVDSFIPAAVELACCVNTPEHKRFVWTTGSYLIKYYLEHADQTACARFCEALRLGYVSYHALPLTTHTELMSAELFSYGLSIAKRLDELYGRTTVAAKMTDVPGHTAAMVPLLAAAGVRYLHIGVNGSSRAPRVPALFRWRFGGGEIAVSYAGAYGDAAILKSGVALEFQHTMDNSGPPKREEIDTFFAALALKYPNAHVEAGTLDDFAAELPAVWDALPVVTEEIGDTWIHGVASDPLKTARFKRLLALVDRWLASGTLTRGGAEYEAVMEALLLVSEHTWGMDTKKHLLDFSNWSKLDFVRARERDRTDYSLFGEKNRQIFEAVREELREYRGDDETSSYRHFEQSHAEQRAYIGRALAALSPEHRAEAERALAMPYPGRTGECRALQTPIEVNGWTVVIDAHGVLVSLKNGRLGIDRRVSAGQLLYETFDGRDVDDCFFAYGRDLDKNFAWAACDFGKPGLRYAPGVQHGVYATHLEELRQQGDTLTAFLRADAQAAEEYGCPREIAISYRFLTEGIVLSLAWRQKDAIRSPEALWLGIDLNTDSPHRWRMTKLGRELSPLEVVSGGNRKLHAVERLRCESALESLVIEPVDAPLTGMGGRDLYDVSDTAGDLRNGFWFLLCNNRWGTNFPQWFEDDLAISFRVSLRGRAPAVR